jgi:hypothetical protein
MLTLDPKSAASADNIASNIRETGKYIGVFTRAEKLLSKNGTQGVGLSFKSDDGQTADYLDLYTVNASGEDLPSLKTVNALMACLGLHTAEEGNVSFEKWNKAAGAREKVSAVGYPDLMNKKVGLLLQKEVYSDQNGDDRERVSIYGVFNASNELTASEIMNRKTSPEKLPQILQALMARPVKDTRNKSSKPAASNSSDLPDDFYFPK